MHSRLIASNARTVLYAFTFVLLEWLFLATKPSFLGTWPISERVLALFSGALPFIAAALAMHLVAGLLAWICIRNGRERLATALLRLTPALIAAAIALLLVDNFSYTMFGWGIVRTTLATAIPYWVLLLAVVILVLRRKPGSPKLAVVVAGLLLLASGVALGWSLHAGPGFIDSGYRSAPGKRLPNIIVFASDGVNADFTSAYGYSRKTTPNLDKYLSQALVADNAFTNSGWTTGSLTSILTGKYPTTTKVLYPPYTLQGEDAFQSLPRILRALGYRNLQETVRYYADSPDLNMEEAFDQANGRAVDSKRPSRFALALQHPAKLVESTRQRLVERLLQLARVRQMQDPYAQVVDKDEPGKVMDTSDANRMQRVADFIAGPSQPFFIQIHLMGTHCCSYHPRQRFFSKGNIDDKRARRQAGLDDAILESDRRFGAMMEMLKQRGLLGNTIVVYTSDHNTNWDVRARIPLVLLFPGGEHKGHVGGDSQLIDVAPTLLDSLGVEIPPWMEGESMLHGDFEPTRPIHAVYRIERSHFRTKEKENLAKAESTGPPTYGLTSQAMIVCQRWYLLRLKDSRVAYGDMEHYRGACAVGSLPNEEQAAAMISQHLHERGFEF